MVTVMNEYVSNIKLSTDEVTKGILKVPLSELNNIIENTVLIKSNRYIVDIRMKQFAVDAAVAIMNHFMENTRYHYSSFYIRFNEGNMVRYRYATCRENREGFYCDVVIH